MRRLNKDHIVGHRVHSFDETTQQEDTILELDDIVRSGKTRFMGCCNYKAQQVCLGLWCRCRHDPSHTCTPRIPTTFRTDRPSERYSALSVAVDWVLQPTVLWRGVYLVEIIIQMNLLHWKPFWDQVDSETKRRRQRAQLA